MYYICVYYEHVYIFLSEQLIDPRAVEFFYAIYDCSHDIVKYSRQIWSVFLKKVKCFYITFI